MHGTGFCPVQAPVWHVSVCVHPFPSLQVVPSGLAGLEQAPVVGLHVPALWHASSALHTTGLAPVHVPAWQVSVCVHASPSWHGDPLAFGTLEQSPVAGSQAPASLHSSSGAHTIGFCPTHAPAWHLSVWVQGLLSLHPAPSGLFTAAEHAPVWGLHAPGTWHGPAAGHTTGLPATQAPF
jgi:hypothetical protein